MFYKSKYQGALKQIKELEEQLIEERKDNIDKHWNMLCRINDLIKEVNKLEKEIRQYGENSNPSRNEKRTRNK